MTFTLCRLAWRQPMCICEPGRRAIHGIYTEILSCLLTNSRRMGDPHIAQNLNRTVSLFVHEITSPWISKVDNKWENATLASSYHTKFMHRLTSSSTSAEPEVSVSPPTLLNGFGGCHCRGWLSALKFEKCFNFEFECHHSVTRPDRCFHKPFEHEWNH